VYKRQVDDHAEPLDELERLYRVAEERFVPFSAASPKSERDPGIFDRSRIEAMVAEAAGGDEL
jgi:uncharacterized Ntn-hydrolase superfamily protein